MSDWRRVYIGTLVLAWGGLALILVVLWLDSR